MMKVLFGGIRRRRSKHFASRYMVRRGGQDKNGDSEIDLHSCIYLLRAPLASVLRSRLISREGNYVPMYAMIVREKYFFFLFKAAPMAYVPGLGVESELQLPAYTTPRQ